MPEPGLDMIAGRRRHRGSDRRHAPVPAAPSVVGLTNPYRPIDQISTDEVEAIHQASLSILEEIGVRVLSEEARGIFREGGAEIDESSLMVRLDRGLVEGTLACVRSPYAIRPIDPKKAAIMGGNSVSFAAVAGPPNVQDNDRGRRSGTLDDFKDFLRLQQHFDVIQVLTPAIEPLDVKAELRHLHMTHAMLTLCDKFPFIYCRNRAPAQDALRMVDIRHGSANPVGALGIRSWTVVNVNSPLQFDKAMSHGIIDFARAGQLCIVTPFTLAGAAAPISLAGAVAQQNAEALAGVTLSQLTRPGAPVMYGGFTSNVDMKSGAPAFGTPEYVKAAFASGQMARRYGLPWRSSNASTSKVPDAQAAYESQMSLWGALMGGANLVIHAAGWLEGGLTASLEKFIIDIEMLGMFAELFRPMLVNEAELAVEAIREVGPGGHFFGSAHTLERYRTAFYQPILSDWSSYGNWAEAGSQDASTRANRLWKKALADFQPPPLDTAIAEELDEFVARRIAEGGARMEE